jgi:uncharacterized membrane protein YgcG
LKRFPGAVDSPGNSYHLSVLNLLGVDFMKTPAFQRPRLTIVVLTTLALAASNLVAQDSTTSTTAATSSTASADQPAAVSQPAPQLSYGVSEVLQLSQAKVADSVIVSYVQTSGNNYGLNAAQIIYLRQQGVSDPVINTMLNQRTQSAQIAAATTTPAPEAPAVNSAPSATTTATQPAVAYVPATASTVYVVPDTQTYNYNAWLYSRPYYGYYPYNGYYPYYPYYPAWPAISLSFGFGGYYGGGYHYHGGSSGGWHGGGGGGWHGGGGHH